MVGVWGLARTFDFLPSHRHLGDRHVKTLRYIQHLHVKRPPVYVHVVEEFGGGASRHELKAALSVPHASNAQKPDEEVEALHQECTE